MISIMEREVFSLYLFFLAHFKNYDQFVVINHRKGGFYSGGFSKIVVPLNFVRVNLGDLYAGLPIVFHPFENRIIF